MKLLEFLKQLEKAVPPPDKCHHALMYSQYGSEETKWEDKLCLQVNVNGVFFPFFLDDDEFNEIMIAQIMIDLKNQATAVNWQLSYTLGKAGKWPPK
jgi:hypothetical protein